MKQDCENAGKFMGLNYMVWKDSAYPTYYWKWGNYGGQVESMASCWESIRRAACVWEKDSAGNWRHSSEAITS